MSGSSTLGIKIVLHPVSDLEKAKPVYAALLGISPQSDAPYYVGFDLEGEHVIEFHAGFVEHADSDESANEGIAFEEALGVFFVESEELTSGTCQPSSESRLYLSLTYRAARRILERVSWTRQTSRLFLNPYSPTIFNSESLLAQKRSGRISQT